MLGLIPKDVDTKCRKRYVNARDIAEMNKHLADQLEQHMKDYKNTFTAAEIYLYVPYQE